MIIAFTAEETAEASDQSHHLTQGWWRFRELGAVGDDPGGLPFLGVKDHLARQVRTILSPGKGQLGDRPHYFQRKEANLDRFR